MTRSKSAPVYRYIATRELLKQQELPGMEGSDWLHKRCGKSEEAHSIMKEDRLPSSDFGENAAWWGVMELGHATG